MAAGLQIIVVFVVFLGLLAVGMEVPFAIGLPALLYLFLLGGFPALKGLGLVSWGSMNNFTLTSIPLFMLMAEIMQRSGLSFRVYTGLAKLVSRLPGGLLQTNIAGCAMFAAVSGSSVATAAAIGGVALPQLMERNYDPRLSAGSLAAGGTLGILIPPSIAMIVYGTFTETSVAKLFVAGIAPGLLLSLMFMAYTGIHALIRPEIAPREEGSTDLAAVLRAVLDLVPFVILIGGTIGSLYLGLATPTEAAAVGCVLALTGSAIWGDLSGRVIRDSLQATVRVSGNILLIVFTAFLFSYAISIRCIGDKMTTAMVQMEMTKTQFFLALIVLFTVLGALVESLGMIVITVPLLYPVVLKYGIDPVWFGVLLVLFIELGQITPPIGINLFVIQGIWDGKLGDVVMGTIPYHLLMFVMVGLLILWPDIALWLPNHMGGR